MLEEALARTTGLYLPSETVRQVFCLGEGADHEGRLTSGMAVGNAEKLLHSLIRLV